MNSELAGALEMLGVTADSDPATVARAYRGLARATHPDVSPAPDATERFAAVTAAYHLVSQAARRSSHPGTDPPAPPTRAPASEPVRGGLLLAVPRCEADRVSSRPLIVAGPVRIHRMQ